MKMAYTKCQRFMCDGQRLPDGLYLRKSISYIRTIMAKATLNWTIFIRSSQNLPSNVNWFTIHYFTVLGQQILVWHFLVQSHCYKSAIIKFQNFGCCNFSLTETISSVLYQTWNSTQMVILSVLYQMRWLSIKQLDYS